jgi:hypothetical protein
MKTRLKDNVEGRILRLLLERQSHAISEKELSSLTGIRGNSFKEVMIRLLRKNLIAKWKNEQFVNYVVAREFADSAYYLERITINPLYLAFGHETRAVTVRRSIPFVSLEDDDVERRNRYASMVA